MSNEFSIAAVTLALRNLLDKIQSIKDSDEFDQLPADAKPTAEILVTNLPLDEAYKVDKAKNQVNLFLYHIEHSATWRNMENPGRVKPGETGHPPLAINLYYIITAYGQNGNELIGHLLLGKAMSLLHDHTVFGKTDLRNAFAVSGLHEQIERVRITPQPISLENVSKLWTGFQTQYRLSAAYEISVLLIESHRQTITPLPVLTRGPADEGVFVQADLIPPFPALEEATPPNRQPGVRLGDVLRLTGHHLKGDRVVVNFMTPLMPEARKVVPLPGGTEKEIRVQWPDEPADWPAGFYTLSAQIGRAGEQDRTTNTVPLMLVPGIETIDVSPLIPPVEGRYLATVTCSPHVLPEQTAALLLGSRALPAHNHPTKTDALTFPLTGDTGDEHYVRLRIDGVDSLLVDRSVTPPSFDESQKVTIP